MTRHGLRILFFHVERLGTESLKKKTFWECLPQSQPAFRSAELAGDGALRLRRSAPSIPSVASERVRASPRLLLLQQRAIPALFHRISNLLRPSLCRRNFCSKTAIFEAKQAQLFLDEMRHRVADFILLVGVIVRMKHYVAAIGLIKRWMSLLEKWEGRICRVNVVAYSTVVDGLCKEGKSLEALKLFNRMVDRGVEPNIVTLIHAMCSAGQWEDVEVLLAGMNQRDVRPYVLTFTTIVDALCKDGMFSEAESTFDAIIRRSIEPDVVTYSSLIAGYCLQNRMDAAENLFHSRGSCTVPAIGRSRGQSEHCGLTILINGMCNANAGRLEHAKRLFSTSPGKGCQPNVVAFNTLINGTCRGGHVNKAHKLLQEMKRKRCSPDGATYDILIRAALKNNELLGALELVCEMRDDDFSLDSSTMELLLDDRLDPNILKTIQDII
ncbi:hypothetical protein CRG98_019059 [Punica granatum]|uniref:Pentatricopeptide repeat-containing protein n=2 Tax=Punica granatum TaxID=22663 RepID=A0A2I0JXK9_PUNGR|nr:hypothetical protein CRG98_019059 [Punica granatum]